MITGICFLQKITFHNDSVKIEPLTANDCKKRSRKLYQSKNKGIPWSQKNDLKFPVSDKGFRFQIPKAIMIKVSKGAKIRSRYNQVPHPTQDTNGKVTNSQLDTTNESQEISPFPAGDHRAHINRRAQRHSKHKREQKHKRSTKEVPPWNGQ